MFYQKKKKISQRSFKLNVLAGVVLHSIWIVKKDRITHRLDLTFNKNNKKENSPNTLEETSKWYLE